MLVGCATNLWVKFSACRPIFQKFLPSVADLVTTEGNDRIRSPHRPSHPGLFEPLPNDCLATSLNDSRSHKQILIPEIGITHPFPIDLKTELPPFFESSFCVKSLSVEVFMCFVV
jgi:hypothetical protein